MKRRARFINNVAAGYTTSHCRVWLQHTWPPTVSWSPTTVVVSCILPIQGRVVKRTYSSYETDALLAAGPRLWNSLPAHLRQTDINFEQFKRMLKTFLFRC